MSSAAESLVNDYRYEQFLKVGFDESFATLLADLKDIDLEKVRRLKDQGCPLNLILKIVY